MSTYRERRLNRADRLETWADKRRTKAAAAFNAAHTIVSGIPLGQPILIGHHSEKRHRRDLDRMAANMDAGVQHERTADSMESRAANIRSAVDDAIYMDDPDAIERLTAKIAALEADRERHKAENAAFRKGDEAYAAFHGISVERAIHLRAEIMKGYSWCRQPHPTYSLQNLGATINKEKKRLAQLQRVSVAPPPVDAPTATGRAGLTITAGMTTPRKSWKQPRAVWNVTGNTAAYRSTLERLGGSWYRGAFSFWEDPTIDLEAALLEGETATGQ